MTLKHILWKKYKWVLLGLILFILLAAFVIIFLYSVPVSIYQFTHFQYTRVSSLNILVNYSPEPFNYNRIYLSFLISKLSDISFQFKIRPFNLSINFWFNPFNWRKFQRKSQLLLNSKFHLIHKQNKYGLDQLGQRKIYWGKTVCAKFNQWILPLPDMEEHCQLA